MLNKRSHIIEDLDNFDFQGKELEKTLDGLCKINRWFGNTNQTLRFVQTEIKENQVKTIVDLGCGGGDNLRAIAQWCEANDKQVKLIGIDGNKYILEYAKSKGHEGINYIQADVLSPDFEIPPCDLLMSSHFMYHFEDEELVKFLKKAKQKTKRKVFFSELERNIFAFLLFTFIGVAFGRIVKSDGLKAIKRAFRKKELETILRRSGFQHFSVQRKIWFRLLVKADVI